MASDVTLGSMVAKARRMAKMEQSTFITDGEIRERLMASIARVYDKLHMGGQEVNRYSMELNTIVGQPYYVLPADYYRVLAVIASQGQVMNPPSETFITSNSTSQQGWRALRPFMMQEMAGLLNSPGVYPTDTRYRVGGIPAHLAGEVYQPGLRLIELRPTPAASFTLRLEYLPVCKLADNNDFPVDMLNGFEIIPVLEATIYMLSEEESDTSRFDRWLAQQEERLDMISGGQDRTRPETIVDVDGITDAFDPYGLGRGIWGGYQ